ncbi:hypothetical protein AOQ84DRAFT_205641 [Glonium stellatum]|uniref:Uncharacterized protein n=1 Tax=Glonium stellatum TaxID=574774 RepID=A0A8E2JLH9_9PEZI|nr:hypothetical protein AOQ84DRAFT_205641 [Glonium stellatum]
MLACPSAALMLPTCGCSSYSLMLMFPCSHVPMFQCSNAAMLQYSNVSCHRRRWVWPLLGQSSTVTLPSEPSEPSGEPSTSLRCNLTSVHPLCSRRYSPRVKLLSPVQV